MCVDDNPLDNGQCVQLSYDGSSSTWSGDVIIDPNSCIECSPAGLTIPGAAYPSVTGAPLYVNEPLDVVNPGDIVATEVVTLEVCNTTNCNRMVMFLAEPLAMTLTVPEGWYGAGYYEVSVDGGTTWAVAGRHAFDTRLNNPGRQVIGLNPTPRTFPVSLPPGACREYSMRKIIRLFEVPTPPGGPLTVNSGGLRLSAPNWQGE